MARKLTSAIQQNRARFRAYLQYWRIFDYQYISKWVIYRFSDMSSKGFGEIKLKNRRGALVPNTFFTRNDSLYWFLYFLGDGADVTIDVNIYRRPSKFSNPLNIKQQKSRKSR